MSVAASALALSRPFEFEGNTYQLRPLTYEDLARFSLTLEERAKAAVERAIANGDGDPRTLYGAFLDRVAAGKFEPGSDVFDDATRTPAGGRQLLAYMLAGGGGKDGVGKEGGAADPETLSWEIYADAADFDRALALVREINSDPSAARMRRTPARPAAPSR